MGSYVYAVRKPSVKLSVRFKLDKVEARLAKFVCRQDCCEAFDRQLSLAETNYGKAEPAKYIVLGDDLKELYGQTVYEYHGGALFNDDCELGVKHPEVGIILGRPRAWYLETNKEVIEKIHRQYQFQAMKRRKLSIGEFGYDADAYEEYLHGRDKEAKAKGERIYFQGYRIS